jgi:hypothetical protein
MRTILTLFLFVSIAAHSEDDHAFARRVINEAGHRCDAVTNFRPGARVDDGSTMLIVDCSDGSSHVVKYGRDKSLRYYMDCASWLNPVRCEK